MSFFSHWVATKNQHTIQDNRKTKIKEIVTNITVHSLVGHNIHERQGDYYIYCNKD